MRVHKGGQINNVQLITGVGQCRDVTTTKLIVVSKYPKSTVGILHKKRNGGCQLRRIIVKIRKKEVKKLDLTQNHLKLEKKTKKK